MKPLRFLISLKRNEEGSFLTIWGVSLAVLLGFLALSFDLGRIGITQTELQSYADSVALAAAGELDGGATAIDRATAAAAAMISDEQTFADGNRVLSGPLDYTLTFLSVLPPLDTMPTSAVTTDPEQARYVRVDVAARSVGWTFGAAFRGLRGEEAAARSTVRADAVAGFTQIACDISSMMMCLPDGFDASREVGTAVRLRAGGGSGGQWGAGNYGFLQPTGGATATDPAGACAGLSSGNEEWCVLAAQRPVTTCFEMDGVDTRPGQSVGRLAAAVNTRFDIYEGVLNSHRGDPRFGPAPNVISGVSITRRGNGQCNIDQVEADDPLYTVPLPADDCLISESCTGGRFGDGDFASGYANYVATNYGTAPEWFPDYPTTRYGIYLAEIANAIDGDVLTGRQETGAPVCNAENASADPERRVMIVAGIDCEANAVSGASTGVPVESWVRVFLLQPADNVTKDIFVEILGSAGAGSGGSGTVRDVVRLYR
ncbi:Tad domain-containing protein [Roseibacterium sp. SDUM158016]|uniref:Tad domain-containing protein n=1 Tax=Roseicyclus sediminis TaxID=2980997 RepID=UPI0021D2732F|nr:Tad domain-containing protein [Roseibacterium sp. SDUM158016]MCU4654271.1 Tad domain-containing protein [Roseibacterium sp. SDUM158016]